MLFAKEVIIGCKDTKAKCMKGLAKAAYQKGIFHKAGKHTKKF
jgi:hypothetical protein